MNDSTNQTTVDKKAIVDRPSSSQTQAHAMNGARPQTVCVSAPEMRPNMANKGKKASGKFVNL